MQQRLHTKWVLLFSVISMLFLTSQTANAHCQVPCGIFDDYARVEMMLEHAVTVDKATDLINELADKKDAQSQNQLVRWVINKEEHAEEIISIISSYFLAQRVKSTQEDYEKRLLEHHAVMVSAMKVKQNVDLKLVDKLIQDINALIKYYPEHVHKAGHKEGDKK